MGKGNSPTPCGSELRYRGNLFLLATVGISALHGGSLWLPSATAAASGVAGGVFSSLTQELQGHRWMCAAQEQECGNRAALSGTQSWAAARGLVAPRSLGWWRQRAGCALRSGCSLGPRSCRLLAWLQARQESPRLLFLLASTHRSSLLWAAEAVSSGVPSPKRSSARRDLNGIFWGAGGSGEAAEGLQRQLLGASRRRGRDLAGLGEFSLAFGITNPTVRAGCWFWDNSGGGRAVLIRGCHRFWLSRLWWWWWSADG